VKQNDSYIKRLFTLIDCFAEAKTDLGVREVSRNLNISRSATGRMMKDLKEEGVLTQDPDTTLYSLGARVLKWAGGYLETSDLCKRSLPYMRHLFNETNESISLYAIEGNERVCVERFESLQNVRMVEEIGQHFKLYAGSGGRAILAFMQPAEIERILEIARQEIQETGSQIDLSEIHEHLNDIRKLGYSLSHGQWLSGASGIAAPILGESGLPLGSVSISGPTDRFLDPVKIEKYKNLLLSNMRELSREMGFES
jgi:DNA-binding IclR family transcriptional regulator